MKITTKQIKNLLGSKVSKNSMWLLVLQGFNTLLPLVTLPYITRILSGTAYGEFSIALNLIGYLQVLVEYGFGLAGARKVATAKDKEQLNTIHSGIISARFILLILCLVVLGAFALFSGYEKSLLICMGILFLMVVATVFQQNWFFQGISEMKNITLVNIVSRTISVILIFCLVKETKDLYLYCLLYSSNYIISSFLGCVIVRVKYGVRFLRLKFSHLKRELIEGWSLFVSSAMIKIFGGIGITILGIVAQAETVGIYAAINKIPYVLTLLFSSISQAIYPHVCKEFEEDFNKGIKKVKKYGVPVISVFFVIGIIIILLHRQIVGMAFGKGYVSYSTLLIPFVIWALFGIVNNFLGIQILVASGANKEYSRAFTISVIVMLSLMFILGYFFGAYGIAYASMISEVVLSCIFAVLIKRRISRSNQN